jgi:hypothetical protein
MYIENLLFYFVSNGSTFYIFQFSTTVDPTFQETFQNPTTATLQRGKNLKSLAVAQFRLIDIHTVTVHLSGKAFICN